jgi:hypothetical protein
VVAHPVEFADGVAIDANTTPNHEIELAPGDVLFIPRGEPHAAAVLAGRSVHLTIGLRSETGIDFLGYIHKKAAQDALLRMNLPRQVVDERSDAHEAALKRRLHQLIDATSMSQFVLSLTSSANCGTRCNATDGGRSAADFAPARAIARRTGRQTAARHDRRRSATSFSSVNRCFALAFRSRSDNFARAARRADTPL